MSDSIALTLVSPAAPPVAAPAKTEAKTAGTPFRIWFTLAIILAVGVALRVLPWHGFQWIGFDENIYKAYVEKLDTVGLAGYPEIVHEYVASQRASDKAFLPPTRFLYIFGAATWRAAFYGDAPYTKVETMEDVDRNPTLRSLRAISTLFTCLTLLVTAVFARKIGGDRTMLCVTALMACAPTQLHMAQHGLIDGFCAFWALSSLWLLWENLHAPNDWRWLTAYAASLGLMVLAKESAVFVVVALCGVLATAHFARWGRITPKLLLCTVAGPALGLGLIIALSGGFATFYAVFELFIPRAQVLRYNIVNGDGPWYRYLVDLLLASPLVLLLAVGAILQLKRDQRALLFVTAFLAGSYLLLCNVKYGMNLRFANMWDMPLRLLAVTQLGWFAARFPAKQNVLLGVLVVGLAAFELHQYQTLFVTFDRDYEMVSANLLIALKMLKLAPVE